ncbi:hypothetical protein MJO29_011407 [Puccinia striiformis f. sp. tritici]|nr:hypothetical protein MJO29_011407 [Puccinia striiformis f. sp. tritici]
MTGKHGFRLASPKQVPTSYSSTGKGFTLDLTWANFLGSKIINFVSVSENNHSSDHQALIISLAVQLAATPLKVIQPNWKKMVPEKARLSTRHLINQLDCPVSGSVNTQVPQITEVLLQSQLKLSKRVNSEGSRLKGWWDSAKLDPIVDSRNRARKWFILSRSPEAAECYRQWNVYFKSTVVLLKRKSWWDFLEKSSNESIFKALRFTKKAGSNGILPLRRPNGSLTTDKAEQAKLLFYGTSVVLAPIDLSDVPPRIPSRIVCFSEFSVDEVQADIQRIRPKKAPGIDGITNKLIKLFPAEISSSIRLLLTVPFLPRGNVPLRPLSLTQGSPKKGALIPWGEEQNNAFKKFKFIPPHKNCPAPPPQAFPPLCSGYRRVWSQYRRRPTTGSVGAPSTNHTLKPIAYESRKPSKTKQNYSAQEQELLPNVHALKHFRGYVEGSPVLVRTDHESLKFFKNQRHVNRRLARFVDEIPFNVHIIY